MATLSSNLAWRLSWTEEPDGLYIVHGVVRVGHDLATKAPLYSISCDNLQWKRI